MKKIFSLIFLLIAFLANAQGTFKNDFYEIKIPDNTIVKPYQKSIEELSNTESFIFELNGKPKYILFLLSHKLLKKTELNEEDLAEFSIDLGENLIVDKITAIDKSFKVEFHSSTGKIKQIVYYFTTNDILNRFMFVFPNEEIENKFKAETETIVSGVKYLKEKWDK